MKQLKYLRDKWSSENVMSKTLMDDEDLALFESRNNVMLPQDLIAYAKTSNRTDEQCDWNFFQFYALDKIANAYDRLKDSKEIPDYSNIINTLPECEKYFYVR